MLHPEILKRAKEQGRTFPYETRTLTWAADELVVVTPLLRRYLQLGLKIKKIHYAIQYAPTKPFRRFVDDLVEVRIKSVGTNPAKGDRAKYALNSAIGKFGLNLVRQRNTTFALEKNLQNNIRTPLVERYHTVNAEYETGVFEIVKKKSKIKDTIAVHCSLFIYQLSKLHFLNFVLVLHEYFREGSFRLVYCDTDSLMLSLESTDLDDLVVPEKLSDWKQNVYPKWFADETPRQQKWPGYLKSEFATKNGTMCALSSKCYLVTDGKRFKKSTKGTPRHINLTLNAYENALFGGEIPTATFGQLVRDRKVGGAVTKTTSKKAINPLYLKMRVSGNLVDVSPFKQNNKYV